MEKGKNSRVLVHRVLSLTWLQHKLTRELPEEATTKFEHVTALADSVHKIIAVEIYVAWSEWKQFLNKHSNRLLKNPSLYVTYVTFLCYAIKENSRDLCECFIRSLGLVAECGLFASSKGRDEYRETSIEIFSAFFNRELAAYFFENNQGWMDLGEEIKDNTHLKIYDLVLALESKKKTQSEIASVFKLESKKMPTFRGHTVKRITERHVEKFKEANIIAFEIGRKVLDICEGELARKSGQLAESQGPSKTSKDERSVKGLVTDELARKSGQLAESQGPSTSDREEHIVKGSVKTSPEKVCEEEEKTEVTSTDQAAVGEICQGVSDIRLNVEADCSGQTADIKDPSKTGTTDSARPSSRHGKKVKKRKSSKPRITITDNRALAMRSLKNVLTEMLEDLDNLITLVSAIFAVTMLTMCNLEILTRPR